MQKMEKLFKLRRALTPWFHWSTIHFILNTASLLTLLVTLCFTGITELTSTWFIACMVQYFPLLIVFAGAWIFETVLYKNVLAIIKSKLSEKNIDIKNVNLSLEDFALNSCTLCVNNNSEETSLKEFVDIVEQLNSEFGNNYSILCVEIKCENTK